MKTTLLVTIAAAFVVLVVARAQFGSTQPPAALPEPGLTEGVLSVAPSSEPGGASNEPVAAASGAPVPNPFAAAPAGSPVGLSGKAPSPGGFGGFGNAGQPPPSSGAQMLRESELKVLRRHYENVLQRALEAEEKVHVATKDSAGNAKGQPDEDAAAHRERAAVLRHYAGQLKSEIAVKSAESGPEGVMTGMGGSPMVAVPVPGESGASDAARAYERSLREYPVGGGNLSGATPLIPGNRTDRRAISFSSGYASGGEAVSGKITLLSAQIRAQQAALASEEVSLEEAMDDLKRVQELSAQKLVSAEEASRKEYAVKKSKARMEQMKAEIDATKAELAMAKTQFERLSTPPAIVPPPVPARIPGVVPGLDSAPTPTTPGLPPPVSAGNPGAVPGLDSAPAPTTPGLPPPTPSRR